MVCKRVGILKDFQEAKNVANKITYPWKEMKTPNLLLED